LEQLAISASEPDLADLAKAFLMISCRRKEVVYRAGSRISCVISLLEQLSDTLKILIFNERIDITNNLYEKLRILYPNQVGRYHSEMNEDDKRNVLMKYQNSKIRILVACKALDEGLNVPETDVGIIVSSTNSSRQRIQRLGRILRRSRGADVSRLFYLYVGSSNEDQELLADMNREMKGVIPMIDLRYDEETREFYNKDYQALTDKVLRYAQGKVWPPLVIDEIKRNLELGKLGCDWWQSEESCKMRIRLALTKPERNYWETTWLVIKARLRKLAV
jgi:superfamily II DNA or RNA helicase